MALSSLEKEKQFKLQEKPGQESSHKEALVGKESTEITEVIGAVSEVTDLVAEGNEGNISEKVSGKKDQSGAGSMTQGDGAQAGTTHIKIIPKIEVMIIEVSNAIEAELKSLGNKAEKAANPHELSAIVAKIRDLNFTLSNLGSITFEAIKALWLKFVKKN